MYNFCISKISLKACVVLITKFNGHFNKPLINVSIGVYNDGVHDGSLDFWWEQFVTIERLFVYARLNVPKDEGDEEFTKEFLRVSIDGVKLFNQGYNNFAVKMMMDSILANIDWEPKFPLLKVLDLVCKEKLFSNIYYSRVFTESRT